jgi:hypothetical protein
MDVLIVGPARSGTTLLANLMTSPSKRWVLVEPGITRGGMGEVVRQEAGLFGWHFEPASWHLQESSRARFDRLLRQPLNGLERWGVKEVNVNGLPELLAAFPPRHIVVSVRDIRACAISARQKEDLQGCVAGTTLARKTDDWLRQRLLDGAAAALRLLTDYPSQSQVTVVRYEDFVASPEARTALSHGLDWPLEGDPSSTLDFFGRTFEVERHGGHVGTSSLHRWQEETDPVLRAFADEVASGAAGYQRAFGYTQ